MSDTVESSRQTFPSGGPLAGELSSTLQEQLAAEAGVACAHVPGDGKGPARPPPGQ